MSRDHHIHRQSIVLEAPGLGKEDGWHERLARWHEYRLMPVLEEALDAADDRTTQYIERLEITCTLDDLNELDGKVVTRKIALQLQKALGKSRSELPTVHSRLEMVLDYLRTGNLPRGIASVEALRTLFAEWPVVAREGEWKILFTAWAKEGEEFFLRGTQVQGEFMQKAWSALNSMSRRSAATGTVNHYPPAEPAQWVARLESGGFGGPSSSVSATQPERDEFAERAWHPDNAGIVLLHPYLGYLLQEIECEEAGRAAALFHYLVWGKVECGEWDLPLTKLLLGLHPDDHLPPDRELRSSDQDAADKLLQGVIGHWTVLKNTSIHALRQGFLQRSGRLSQDGPGWRLVVERKPQDVLINRLPWAIGIVRSRDMKTTLYVDWP